jgi:hypothetical protein
MSRNEFNLMNQESSCAHAIVMTASPKSISTQLPQKQKTSAERTLGSGVGHRSKPTQTGSDVGAILLRGAATSNRQTGWKLVFWANFFGQSCSHDISHLDRDLRLARGVRLIFVPARQNALLSISHGRKRRNIGFTGGRARA